ncbi:hypothetical protein CZ787_01265 [Halomonas citrativorans]|uniref:Uncharacterized protein n=1 Tax=Halomonas citrativorans TaxID=2742612 RepID=A0A1R4HP37_9GAMM|nr:hypothetical protein [Halomonas citrativorans]SJN09325.1 hypothetical protein CZ787_01265 [Halomonas citrativorans]
MLVTQVQTIGISTLLSVIHFKESRMDRIFAWDDHHNRVVYRIPGCTHKDGREDSDLSPVWLPAKESELPKNVCLEDLRRVSVDE